MSSYRDVSCIDIARELGINEGRNGNFHCFRPDDHQNGDADPSLQISDDGFKCHGCNIKGNNVELVKLYQDVEASDAIRWIKQRFGLTSAQKVAASMASSQSAASRYHIRLISPSTKKRFIHAAESEVDLRDPGPEDIAKIREILGKSYSLETLRKAGIRINHSPVGYGMVFGTGQLVFNPGKVSDFLHVEGRTDYLTAIELGLDDFYGIVSDYNKTATIPLEGGTHTFILDDDVDEESLRKQLRVRRESRIRFVRPPEGSRDLSDWYNGPGCCAIDVLSLINQAAFSTVLPSSALSQRSGDDTQEYPIYSGDDLLTLEFPAPRWAVPGLLPEGLIILAGSPKSGKSFMALGWCIAVARGGKALGCFQAVEGRSLYIGLEDTASRIQRRLRQIQSVEPVPGSLNKFEFMPRFSKLEEFGAEQLENILLEKPGIRLIVIDTLGRFSTRKSSGNIYEEDVKRMSILQELALRYRIAIVVIHHDNKSLSTESVDRVSGTRGLTGTADAFFLLKKNGYGGTLDIVGREIEQRELTLCFDGPTGMWSVLGDASQLVSSGTRHKIQQAILEQGEALSPKRISELTSITPQNARKTMRIMVNKGQLAQVGHGEYRLPDNFSNFSL